MDDNIVAEKALDLLQTEVTEKSVFFLGPT